MNRAEFGEWRNIRQKKIVAMTALLNAKLTVKRFRQTPTDQRQIKIPGWAGMSLELGLWVFF
jgi:hypothetical protein